MGSLYFPQQPVKTTKEANAAITGPETYALLLEACDKFNGEASAPYMTFKGRRTSAGEHQDWLAQGISAGVDDYQQAVAIGNVINYNGEVGSFMNDQHMIGVNLERSTLFNLAGVPVNNSRVLALHVRCPSTTVELGFEDTPRRSIVVYLKYVKLARVFIGNVEVEQ